MTRVWTFVVGLVFASRSHMGGGQAAVIRTAESSDGCLSGAGYLQTTADDGAPSASSRLSAVAASRSRSAGVAPRQSISTGRSVSAGGGFDQTWSPGRYGRGEAGSKSGGPVGPAGAVRTSSPGW